MGEYDTVILDIMLPKLNGLGVLERLRSKKNMTPILFLTAKDSIEDRVKGLDSGADDYLVKPFAFAELLARIRVLTRKKSGNATNVFSLADLTVNCDNRTVTRCGESIPLTSKEFSILEYMIRNKGIVLQREQIERHIWNYDYEGGSNIIDVYIRYLRKKIDDGFDVKLIHTVRGTGYILKEET
jgi:DNA-binding response OmpR family regulator